MAKGKKYISADMAHEFATRHIASEPSSINALSARELEVLRLLVQGLSVREVAVRMNLNPKTVANHQSAIKQKLGAATPVQLAKIGGELLRMSKKAP